MVEVDEFPHAQESAETGNYGRCGDVGLPVLVVVHVDRYNRIGAESRSGRRFRI